MTGHEVVSRDAVDRMLVTGHRIEVPLDWSRPDRPETINVFAREVVASERVDDPHLPLICWYQGGPGSESPYPASRGGWLEQLLTRYRVLLLDQRGTGLSTPLEARAVTGRDPAELARYLSHFRADAIVRDADRFRAAILGEDADWHLFGQSFGGFCSLTHLSLLPEHVAGVIITGGFAPVLHEADTVYRALADRVAERCAAFYARFPEDVQRVRRILDHLERASEVDATGQPLTPRAFLTLGNASVAPTASPTSTGSSPGRVNDLEQLGMLGGFVHQETTEADETRLQPHLHGAARGFVVRPGGADPVGGGPGHRRRSPLPAGCRPGALLHRGDGLSLDVRGVGAASPVARGRRGARHPDLLAAPL